MSKNDTDKTQPEEVKKKASKPKTKSTPKPKSNYPIEIKDNTIRREGTLKSNAFKYIVSVIEADGSPADVGKVTLLSKEGNTVVSTSPTPNLPAEPDKAGHKTFYIEPDPGKVTGGREVPDTLLVRDSGKELHQTKVVLKANEKFFIDVFDDYGNIRNEGDIIKINRRIVSPTDKGQIVIGISGTFNETNNIYTDTSTSGELVTFKRDNRIVNEQGNYIGPTTIDGKEYTDIIIVELKNKPTVNKTYTSKEVKIWNPNHSRNDIIPKIVFEWDWIPPTLVPFKIINLDSTTPNTPIKTLKAYAGDKVRLMVANEELPQDLTANKYYDVNMKIYGAHTGRVMMKEKGRQITLTSFGPASGHLEFTAIEGSRYPLQNLTLPIVFEEDPNANGKNVASKVRVENDQGRWLTINFNSKPFGPDGIDVNMLGDDLLTLSKAHELLAQIKPTNDPTKDPVTITEPEIKINGEDPKTVTNLVLNNDFTITLEKPPLVAFQARIYGIEFRVTTRDDKMIANLYQPPTSNSSTGSIEYRGWLLLNPVVGVNQCKLFGLNYNETNGRIINSNMVRLDDAKNVLIKSDRRKYTGPMELKLWYRFTGDLNSNWVSVPFTYVQNPTAPFYYSMSANVESRDDYSLIGCIDFKGKTIEELKKSTTVILEELNNETDTPITSGTTLKLSYIYEEIRADRSQGSKVLWSMKNDIRDNKLTEKHTKRDFSTLNIFKDKSIVANKQYWYSAKLGFEQKGSDGRYSTVEISPYLSGYDLSETDGYGVIPFTITNFSVSGTSDIKCLSEFRKGNKKAFDFQDDVRVFIYTKDKGPISIPRSEYMIDRYIWDIIPLDQGLAGEDYHAETIIPNLEVRHPLKDGRYEIRVSTDLDRFGVFPLARREFRINQTDEETTESAQDPETIVTGEYDGLTTIISREDSTGWKYYGEVKVEDLQDTCVRYAGRFVPTSRYYKGDEVNYAGALYVCIKDTPDDGRLYDFKTYFRGMNHPLAKVLYKSGLQSPYQVLDRLGMDSNYTNPDKPTITSASYNHNTIPTGWLKLMNPQGDVLYISKVPVLRNVTLNDLAKADMLHPYQRTIRIGNYLYYPRWLFEDAQYPYEPLLEDFKDYSKYFTKHEIETTTLMRNEVDVLLKLLVGPLANNTNNALGIDAARYSEFVYSKGFPKLMRYESATSSRPARYQGVRVSDGEQLIPSLRLVLERIPDTEKPYNNIRDTIPGSNEILKGSLDPFADTAFLDFVDIAQFVDLRDILNDLNFMEGSRLQSLGFYKFYHQGQILYISDALNLKDVTLDKLNKHNLVNYSPRVTAPTSTQLQSLDRVGRFVYNKMPFSISLLQCTTGPLILSEKNVNGTDVNIFNNRDATLDLSLSRECSFTNTMMSIAINKAPQDLIEGYKGKVPDLDLSSIIKGIGTLSSKDGVMTRTYVKDTNEIVTQNESDLFKIGKMGKDDKGRVVFVISTPATRVVKSDIRK